METIKYKTIENQTNHFQLDQDQRWIKTHIVSYRVASLLIILMKKTFWVKGRRRSYRFLLIFTYTDEGLGYVKVNECLTGSEN